MTLLAAWQLLLARLADQTDIVVGSPVEGRPLKELGSMIGFFMNVINELEDVKLRAQMIRNGNRDTIELLEMKSPAAFGGREPLPVNQYGLRYLAFATGDIGATAAEIRALGGRTFEGTSCENEQARLMFGADPIGARILLVEER